MKFLTLLLFINLLVSCSLESNAIIENQYLVGLNHSDTLHVAILSTAILEEGKEFYPLVISYKSDTLLNEFINKSDSTLLFLENFCNKKKIVSIDNWIKGVDECNVLKYCNFDKVQNLDSGKRILCTMLSLSHSVNFFDRTEYIEVNKFNEIIKMKIGTELYKRINVQTTDR
jgi:hypothetical protein